MVLEASASGEGTSSACGTRTVDESCMSHLDEDGGLVDHDLLCKLPADGPRTVQMGRHYPQRK
jgi:hypothetical protein